MPWSHLEMVFHPEAFALSVDPHVRVRRVVTIHVAPGSRDAPFTLQPGQLVGRLGRERPEVPLHVGVAQVASRQSFLRPDEVLELDRVTYEEHRSVVPDDIQVPLARVEPYCKTSWIAPGIGRAALAGHSGKADHQVRLGPECEHGRLRKGGDVPSNFKGAEGATALGVRLALGDALPIEVCHLLDQVEVLK